MGQVCSACTPRAVPRSGGASERARGDEYAVTLGLARESCSDAGARDQFFVRRRANPKSLKALLLELKSAGSSPPPVSAESLLLDMLRRDPGLLLKLLLKRTLLSGNENMIFAAARANNTALLKARPSFGSQGGTGRPQGGPGPARSGVGGQAPSSRTSDASRRHV
jgi:hypothetical protein